MKLLPEAVVKFSASWCSACKALEQEFADTEKSYPGVSFINISLDDDVETPAKYHVKTLPTVLFLNYGREIARWKKGESLSDWVGSYKNYDG